MRKELQNKREIYEDIHKKCIKEMEDNPYLIEQYKEESRILKDKISEQTSDGYRASVRSVAKAMLSVSRYRVREKLKGGWACGTYISSVRSSCEKLIISLFSEDELKEFIDVCKKNGEFNPHQQEMLLLILYCVPNILVNCKGSMFEI